MQNLFRVALSYIISLVFAIISIPLQLFIFIILLIEIKEFPIFIQDRGITLTRNRFKMIKFKTINSNRNRKSNEPHDFLLPIDEKYVTKFACFLRRNGFDELPQLFHVITFKMNLIGPRPLMISDLLTMKEKYSDQYLSRDSVMEKPGITGLWQLYGNKKNGIVDLIKFDFEYERKKSVLLDLRIILVTFKYVFSGKV